MEPNISVIIPSYNRWPMVADTVANMLGQTLRPCEVIVVDDGSTDGSASHLRERFGDRIRVIEQSNQGPGAARNTGIRQAVGEFIHLMDSDDLVSSNKLRTQAEALMQSGADIAYGPWAPVYIHEQKVRLKDHVLQQRALPSSRDGISWFLTDWTVVLQTTLLRRTAVERAGFYRTDMWSSDDTEYFMRLLTTSAKLVFDDRALTLYRLDDVGKVTGSGRSSARKVVDWAKTVVANIEHAQRAGIPTWRHPQCLLRVQDSLDELCRSSPDEHELAARLTSIREMISSTLPVAVHRKINRVRTGIRRRLYGSSWGPAFQAGPLLPQQRKLVHELGLSFA